MRILYGVVGEGMGHAIRSRVLLERLVRDHEVQVVASGRAKGYLEERLTGVHGIWGFTLAYEDNRLRKWRTVLQNLKGAAKGWPRNIRQYFELVGKFQPEIVISDFESFSYLFGKNHLLPVISFDNMQIINRCSLDPALFAGFEKSFALARSIVKSKLPGCFHYLITTFFRPPLRRQRTTLVPPVLRPEILAAAPEEGEHLLVYQTAEGASPVTEMLRKAGLPCRVYGVRRDLKGDVTEGNVTFRPFSERGFIDDLRTARAVVTSGGFTLMSEAVFLRKPMLAIPVMGQFEQILNALYLQKLGYGMFATQLTPEALSNFLQRIAQLSQALRHYEQAGNAESFAALDLQISLAAERWRKRRRVSS
jgi:uncharacterized protein (TIGR00661 family)